MFYFGAIVLAWIVSASDCFSGTFVNFRFTMFHQEKISTYIDPFR